MMHQADVDFPITFCLHHEIKARFDEYAAAAKTEIGGLIFVEEIDGEHVATDLKIFPQLASNGTFRLDSKEVTKFMMQLASAGRGEDIPKWMNIIHSHPDKTAPFLSGVDEPNLKEAAGRGHAWSVIMTRKNEVTTDSTEYRVHFYLAAESSGDNPFFGQDGVLVQNLPVHIYHPDRAAIRREVEELVEKQIIPKVATRSIRQNGPEWVKMMQTITQEPTAIGVENLEQFEAMGIEEGCSVVIQCSEDSFQAASDDTTREMLRQMHGQEFFVSEFDHHGRAICNGIGFEPEEVFLVADAEGNYILMPDESELH